MGYHVVDPVELPVEPDRPSEMRYVSETVALDHLGLRTYRVEPGEEIPLSGLHYHDEQEEVFYVLAGTLAVETPDRTTRSHRASSSSRSRAVPTGTRSC